MSTVVFWAAFGLLVYNAVCFQLLLAARAALRPRPLTTGSAPTDPPDVTVLIAAHNEEDVIGEKVANVGRLDYPPHKLRCVVVSDGSTDRTVERAVARADERVTVLDRPRTGKAGALNAGLALIDGGIVVFTDANSALPTDTIQRLVAPFGDPAVGGVAGDQRYESGDDAAGERLYWDIDRIVKILSSRSGSVTSATGALYAVRRELVSQVPEGVTDDFALSTEVIERGGRLVFEPAAVAYEPAGEEVGGEYRRKVRVMTRGFRAVALRRRLLNPFRTGFYAWQLFSHKILRRLNVVPLSALFFASAQLRSTHVFYGTVFAALVGFLAIGLLGLIAARAGLRMPKPAAIAGYVLLVNAASVHALWNLLTRRTVTRWTPDRRAEPGVAR